MPEIKCPQCGQDFGAAIAALPGARLEACSRCGWKRDPEAFDKAMAEFRADGIQGMLIATTARGRMGKPN